MVRLPRELAARVDAAADGVPRDRMVRRLVEVALGDPRSGRPRAESQPEGSAKPTRAVRAESRSGEHFRCAVCGQKTVGGFCTRHGEKHAVAVDG